jgi:hypothetical protein
VQGTCGRVRGLYEDIHTRRVSWTLSVIVSTANRFARDWLCLTQLSWGGWSARRRVKICAPYSVLRTVDNAYYVRSTYVVRT